MKIAKFTIPLLGCVAVLASSGCAPILAGGAMAGGVSVAVDRRSTGAQVNDGVIENRVSWEISQKIVPEDLHITVTSYIGKVLLTGEVKTELEKKTAGEVASKSLDVSSVVNQLAVQEPVSVGRRMKDSGIATSVRSRLLTAQGAPYSQMKIICDRGIIYLMGLVTPTEGQIAGEIAAKTDGVKEVVKVFEYQSAAEIKARMDSFQKAPNTDSTSTN